MHLNTSKLSECNATDPCLTISDANSVFKQYLANGALTRCLITFYLVADPLLECRVDAGDGISFDAVTKSSDLENRRAILQHRALLLPGCELASVNATCQDDVFNYRYFMVLTTLLLQNIRLILPECDGYMGPVIYIPHASTTNVTLQNCVFVIYSLCRQVLYISKYSHGTYHFNMQNCMTELLPGTELYQCDEDIFDLKFVSEIGTFIANIRDSIFHGTSAFRIEYRSSYDIAKSRSKKYFHVTIVNCKFLNVQDMYAAHIIFNGGQSLANAAAVKITDVVVTNGRSMESAFRVAGVRHILVSNCLFNIFTGDSIRAARGLEWRCNPGKNSVSGTPGYVCTVHVVNCTLMRSILTPFQSTRHSTWKPFSPFITLEGNPYGSLRTSKCKITNLTVRDYDLATPVITVKYVDVTIDGNTDIR